MNSKNNYQFKKTDVYQKVTDYVIAALEKGQVPWQQKWNTCGLPRNITSGHIYRGWNVFFLNYVAIFKEYKTPFFLTFKQAVALGGHIRKGEKGYPITYWAVVESNNMVARVVDSIAGEETEYRRTRLIPKQHVVFNIDQTEGISYALPQIIQKTTNEKIEVCEKIIREMPKAPAIKHGGNSAFYNRVSDNVQMPHFEYFESQEYYYSTLFHEVGHSTGHQSRLNRKELVEDAAFGSELYSKEELTAEFIAAYLSAVCGIEQKTIENSAAYIQGWLRKLSNDKTLILRASTQAQAATDFILNVSEKQTVEVTTTLADVAA